MKITYKFFISFLLTALMIICLFIGIIQFFIYRNFADYVNQAELERLNNVINSLKEEYIMSNGWEVLKNDIDRLKRIIEWNLPKDHNLVQDFNIPYERRNQQPNDNFKKKRPPPPKDEPQPRAPPIVDPMQIGPRLSVFDLQKQVVVGHAQTSEDHTLKAIQVKGDTVGWLGLKITKDMYHPMNVHFIRQQIKAFYLIGAAILLLVAITSFFLSKHLLNPIRKLAKGARAMTQFKFDTKIDVHSKDELGELTDDFNRMAETIKKYEEIRKQWVVDISHELRTPITVLRGEIEAIQDGVRDMNKDTLNSLHSEVLRLGKLVNDLHQLALADSQSLEINRQIVNPILILKKNFNLFTHRFIQNNIEIHDELEIEKQVMITGDKERLKQLFSNLLENTLKYTDSPGFLKIYSKKTNNMLKLYFEDSAPGVPENELELIFERLYRVDKSRSRALGGSGLGLSICKQIVEIHGGKIKSQHSSLGGLLIIIEFPIISNHKVTGKSI